MHRLLQLLVVMSAVLFSAIGVGWIMKPEVVAPMFGLILGEGVALNSQIGDMSGYFLTLGCCIFLALLTGRRIWYFPAMMLLGFTAIGRILATIFHHASLALELITPEILVILILHAASRHPI